MLTCGVSTENPQPKTPAVGDTDRKSCTAMAQDLFLSVFSHDPYNQETWDKSRRGILEYGGSQQDVLKMLEDFLERTPNMNALVDGLQRQEF